MKEDEIVSTTELIDLQQEDLQLLQKLRLLDDAFMNKCFENDIPSTTLVLQIILDKPDLQVINVHTQVFVENMPHRSVCLDVLATDSLGKKFNIEIQRKNKGAGRKRARYNSSMIDAHLLPKGDDFDDLPETYVIFITEHDVLGKGWAIYEIERCLVQNGERFGDGSHIIYVNGAYRDDTPLGKLMHDFACSDPADMYYDILKERVRFFKESKRGGIVMSGVLEEMKMQSYQEGHDQGEQKKMQDIARKMLRAGKYALEEIADISGISLDEVQKMQLQMQQSR